MSSTWRTTVGYRILRLERTDLGFSDGARR